MNWIPCDRPHRFHRFGALLLLAAGTTLGAVVEVPDSFDSIQSAIDSAADGTTILVEPGTYFESLDFRGKTLSLISTEGAEATVIDASGVGPVVRFATGEGRGSVLRGFTLTNGGDSGIEVLDASPVIEGNRIVGNTACFGAGIDVALGSPLVQGNVIENNDAHCIGGFGGGIALHVGSRAEVIGNRIRNNTADLGAGISLFSAWYPQLLQNEIVDNRAAEAGGGLHVVEQTEAVIAQNLIARNVAPEGGGVWWFVPAGELGLSFVNNTVVDNDSPRGSALFSDGHDGNVEIANNILVSPAGQAALHCASEVGERPLFRHNDVYNPAGDAYGAGCFDMTGLNGNVSVEPGFVDAVGGDYHLAADSPMVDAGDPQSTLLADLDVDGEVRLWDGDLDCEVAVDLGYDERIARPELRLSQPDPGLPYAENAIAIDGAPVGCEVLLLYSELPGPTAVPGCPALEVVMADPQVEARMLGDVADAPMIHRFEVGPETSGATFFVQAVDIEHCAVSNPIRYTFPSVLLGGRDLIPTQPQP